MKSKTDWIVAGDGSNPDYPFGFSCQRCGEKDKLPDRLPFDAFLAWARSFIARHKHCKERDPDEKGKQLELVGIRGGNNEDGGAHRTRDMSDWPEWARKREWPTAL